jgi:hypothetical protein
MKIKSSNSGFASVALIIFTIIAMTVITATTYILVNNALANSQSEQSAIALDIAESGMENGIIRFTRNIGYTGEDMPFNGGVAHITLSPDQQTIQSRGTYGNFDRTIQVNITDYVRTNNLTINSWQETY